MLNEEKITYRMMNLIESGFFGRNKFLLTEAFSNREKVKIFQAAYNYTYDKNIAIDGIKGTQTNAAIEDVKKQFTKDKLDDANTADFYSKFLERLQNDKSINVGQEGVNTNKNLNYAIQALINLAGEKISIDGVIGNQTITAIKKLTNSGSITKDNIQAVIEKAKANINTLGIEDSTSGQTNISAQNKISQGKEGSEEANKSQTNVDTGKADVIFVAGLESAMNAQGQTERLRAGLKPNTVIKTFKYDSLGAIKEFLKSNPKIPIYLFSAGAGNAAALVSDPNVDKNKLYVIEPYTHEPIPPNSNNFVPTRILNILQTADIWSQVYVGKYPTVGSLLSSNYAVKSSNGADHFDALTQVARTTS